MNPTVKTRSETRTVSALWKRLRFQFFNFWTQINRFGVSVTTSKKRLLGLPGLPGLRGWTRLYSRVQPFCCCWLLVVVVRLLLFVVVVVVCCCCLLLVVVGFVIVVCCLLLLLSVVCSFFF